MLDDYKETQAIAYNLMVNEIKNGTVAHAYLIDENGNDQSFNIVLAFVKAILCSDSKTIISECGNCNLCERIDNGNYPEVKIINPDGSYIKKQQIMELQQNFSRVAIEGKKRIYIIRDCDRMKAETANSMLKFLEEPDNNIVAILMTNNYNNILPTIISRCQIIKLNGNRTGYSNNEYEEMAVNFVDSLEIKGIRTIIDTKELWFDKVSAKDRDGMTKVFDEMIDIYYDVLKLKMGNNNIKYKNYNEILSKIAIKNNMKRILFKINYLLEAKDSIKFNVNSNLLIDSVIVNIGGRNESSWS